jgi:hypothetical protein
MRLDGSTFWCWLSPGPLMMIETWGESGDVQVMLVWVILFVLLLDCAWTAIERFKARAIPPPHTADACAPQAAQHEALVPCKHRDRG